MSFQRRDYVFLVTAALLVGSVTAVLIDQPGYVDAYYYFNAAQRLVSGEGLTDSYLWTYIGAPASLPAPSHTYWMPLASLVQAASMAVLGGGFGAAQVPSVLCYAGLVALTAYVTLQMTGGNRRLVWTAGLLAIFSGFFVPFWVTSDAFALFGLVGALALFSMARGRQQRSAGWYAAAGLFSALAHLSRADGMLLAIVLAVVALLPGPQLGRRERAVGALSGLVVYGVVMLPWVLRNMQVVGAPLGVGGLQTAWLTDYNDIVRYPGSISAQEFWDWGVGNILRSRLMVFMNNLGTFVAVETWVVLGPFVIIGLWNRRAHPVTGTVALYALALHAAMTLVFALPGYRGGLFHSSSALIPYWAAFGILGLDDAIGWASKKRRWRRQQAAVVFEGAAVAISVLLSLWICMQRIPAMNDNAVFYRELRDDLPADAVVMVNDPAAFYYHTGLSAVVVPNNPPPSIVQIAERYGVTHVILDVNRTEPMDGLFSRAEDYPFVELMEVYGQSTPTQEDDRRLFQVVGEGLAE